VIKIRQRLGLDIFRRFFEYILDLCDEAGLIWGTEMLADATKIQANADLDSLKPRLQPPPRGAHRVSLLPPEGLHLRR
jgi:hypothetical protein